MATHRRGETFPNERGYSSGAGGNGTSRDYTQERAMRRILFAGAALAASVLAGCSSEDDKSPYLELRGGGFLFNYRSAQATGSLVVGPLRKLPADAVIEVDFENPAGGTPIV